MLSPRSDANSGVTGRLPYNPADYCILASCTALAWAFAVELDLLVLAAFRRRHGLYFWSLLICSWGCILHALGFVLKFLVGTSAVVYLTFIEIGWVAMVSGQAFVLYSRLNLVVRTKSLRRTVLAAIIFDGLALHIPVLIFICGANSSNPHVASRWVGKFNTMERIQLVGFSVQESLISGIYIAATVKLLSAVNYGRTRRAMWQLSAINFICIAMDLVLVGLEFSNNYFGEASAKPLIYAVKLKLEFAVYSQLIDFTKANFAQGGLEFLSHNGNPINTPADFFKKIPHLLSKPRVCSTPTIHTHPEYVTHTEQLLERPTLSKDWGSSEVELTANSIAAAMTTNGRRGGKSARNLINDLTVDRSCQPTRHMPSGNMDGDGPHQSELVPREWSGIYQA